MAKKYWKNNDQAKITEDEIKSKLYGDFVKTKNQIPEAQKNVTEKNLPQSETQFQKKESHLLEKKFLLDKDIQDEIDILKQSIFSLENKLKKTEAQKEKLKIRLVQRRKFDNASKQLVDIVINKFPEKFTVLVIIIVVIGLLLIFLNARPKNTKDKPAIKKTGQESLVKKEIIRPAEPTAIPPVTEKKAPIRLEEKRYTIQVAEYADESAAKNFFEKLQGKGYLVEIDTIYRGENKNRPYYKINVGAFDTFNEAKDYNKELQDQIGINDSFIKERR
ncbi:MAG: SPOR domain-containing protein [Candidatus Omnitrophota bacterium]